MKVRTAPLAAVLATALLITTAMVAAAVEPAPPEAPATSECSTTAPGPAELGEAQELGEVPELTGMAPEPVPTTDPDACEDACISAWAVCLDACAGDPECRNDCHYDKQLCMNDCWTGCHWLNEGC